MILFAAIAAWPTATAICLKVEQQSPAAKMPGRFVAMSASVAIRPSSTVSNPSFRAKDVYKRQSGDFCAGGRGGFGAYLRAVSRRTHGDFGRRRAVRIHNKPEFCGAHGPCEI